MNYTLLIESKVPLNKNHLKQQLLVLGGDVKEMLEGDRISYKGAMAAEVNMIIKGWSGVLLENIMLPPEDIDILITRIIKRMPTTDMKETIMIETAAFIKEKLDTKEKSKMKSVV